eukprot:CAMPEP_0118948070 /NCGR_PEP_ID=MMETSP1169-20130426/47184_1 /TAXON_ID=36882 /ORGANISM="Pyramimonas obovata, Strain CCMP722" /LENGTH=183 /DNA_ID=CAMNT_0006894419 /DNA_START=272 /DNA_END=820 /DNA_ORIENTATION=-
MGHDDIQLQRAIMASLQQQGGGGGSSSGFRNIAPAGRPSGANAPSSGFGRVSRAPPVPMARAQPAARASDRQPSDGGAGRRNRLEREGIRATNLDGIPGSNPHKVSNPSPARGRRNQAIPNLRTSAASSPSSSAFPSPAPARNAQPRTNATRTNSTFSAPKQPMANPAPRQSSSVPRARPDNG